MAGYTSEGRPKLSITPSGGSWTDPIYVIRTSAPPPEEDMKKLVSLSLGPKIDGTDLVWRGLGPSSVEEVIRAYSVKPRLDDEKCCGKAKQVFRSAWQSGPYAAAQMV